MPAFDLCEKRDVVRDPEAFCKPRPWSSGFVARIIKERGDQPAEAVRLARSEVNAFAKRMIYRKGCRTGTLEQTFVPA